MAAYKPRQPPSPHPRKIWYNREFLLSLQFVSATMNKPAGLLHIRDVVLDKQPEPRCFEQVQRDESRKITSINRADVQLNKAEEAWKPAVKKPVGGSGPEEDIEQIKTQEMFRLLCSILNKLTPQRFQSLVEQVMDLTIDTEERLKGAVDLIFEKALSEPNFSVTYASMCRCLIGLKVPISDKPGVFVSFHTLLLRRCQTEFEKDQNDDEIIKKKHKEIAAAKEGNERERLRVELQESRDKAHCRSLGNAKFIGELFKQKMLAEVIMHDCVVKLLKNHDEESLECLCRLLSTAGKDLDSEKTKPCVNQYFIQIEKIVKERKTSSRIRFMLQDVLDLRRSNWVPRRGDQAPKTINQIHKEAEMEGQKEQAKVQQLLSQKGGGGGSRMGGNMEARGSDTPGGGRTSQPQDERWNKVPISKKTPIDTTRLSNITKSGSLDFNNKPLTPRGKGDKDRSGRTGAKPASGEPYSGRPATSTFNRFSIQKEPGSMSSSSCSDCRDPQKCERVQSESAPFPPPKPALSEEQLEKKSKAIIDEYLHINDLKEALQCVRELNSASLLYVFVRKGVESTLELKAKAREQMGLLLHHLVKEGVLPTEQYYKGLEETVEAAEDIAIDVPHIWLYLAELITPMLHAGGIPMGQLFRQISKPLVPLGLAGLLLVQILKLLCKEMTPKKVEAMWTQGRLNWSDFLSEDEDLNKFVTEQNVEYTTGEKMASKEVEKKKVLTGEELSKQLDRLIQNKANNQLIRDWVEANLDEQQTASNQFVQALMTSVCQSAIICDKLYRVNAGRLMQRASLLQRSLCDEQKQLQALYALQALMVHMEQPAYLLQMFFDILFDEDIITEEAFYKWKTSEDPVEQTGKVVTLKSVSTFFTWLHEVADIFSSAPAALCCVD